MLLRRYFWCQFHSNNFMFKFKHVGFKLLRRYLGQFHWIPKVECFASDTAPHLTLLLLTQWPHPFSCNNWSKNLLTLTTLMYNLEISFRFWGCFPSIWYQITIFLYESSITDHQLQQQYLWVDEKNGVPRLPISISQSKERKKKEAASTPCSFSAWPRTPI